ncbi:hypothetical protein B0H15DRAFT_863285 [Mycena belliarum]|uniref:FAD-binding FR-type domain-containing protein n=1 Tax=Mycena belliarum TaxID=1033014 RepID=A0AAD6XK56_9AGAR|nr:hypothetical protein B0H15DRAFT_863285 [Mycena belliae]
MSSIDHGAQPVIPTDFLPYESYTEDPKWQGRFTAMWGAALALCVLLAAPRALRWRSVKRSVGGLAAVRVRGAYEAVPTITETTTTTNTNTNTIKNGGGWDRVATLWTVLGSMRLWSAPGITLNAGQVLVVAVYAAFALVCIVVQAPLMISPNRAGFLALAQLPPVFLFAAKNSPLTALLLGPGTDYTKLNYVHRWSARTLTLAALIHGSLWINNHLVFALPILSQQKEGSGVATLACLLVVALSSAGPVRRRLWGVFLMGHYLAFPAFFITLCYHTIYATPWIFPPLAFFGFDLLLRILRFRVVVGRVEGRGEGGAGMSLIHVPAAASGWRAGQHVQLRAAFGARAWEAHPLSVACAPPGVGCLRGPDGEPLGMLLAARACGDWTRALHDFALTPEPALDLDFDDDFPLEKKGAEADVEAQVPAGDGEHGIVPEKRGVVAVVPGKVFDVEPLPGRMAHLILDGPYGGPTLHAPDYARVLMFAGGSGATFTLGVLDELVGRCTRAEFAGETKTRRVVWCWCVRSFGAINWFAPYLLQIATRAAAPGSRIRLSIRIFVTCLCDPDAVPAIPGCTVTEARPQVGHALAELLGAPSPSSGKPRASVSSSASASTEELPKDVEDGAACFGDVEGGGVALFVAGPGSLIREAGNAAARANLSARGRRAGGVAFCAEAFTV